MFLGIVRSQKHQILCCKYVYLATVNYKSEGMDNMLWWCIYQDDEGEEEVVAFGIDGRIWQPIDY